MEKVNAHEANSELIDRLEKEAIQEISSLEEVIPLHKEQSIELIKTNAFSVRNYLENIEEEGHHLGENFKPDGELLKIEPQYNIYVAGLKHHVIMIKTIPEILKNEGYREAIRTNAQS